MKSEHQKREKKRQRSSGLFAGIHSQPDPMFRQCRKAV
jgi:hypothetical protein